MAAFTALTKQPGAQLSEVVMHHRKPPLPPAKHRCACFAASTVSKKEQYSFSVNHVHTYTSSMHMYIAAEFSKCSAMVQGSLLMQENGEHRRMSATVERDRERKKHFTSFVQPQVRGMNNRSICLHAMWWLQHD